MVWTYDHLRHFQVVAEQADRTEEVEHLAHEQRLKDWYRQVDMAIMAWTGKVRKVTCLAAASSARSPENDVENSHVLRRHGTKLRVIQTALIRQVHIVQQYRIVDLLYRDGPHIVRRQEGEGERGDLGADGVGDIHCGDAPEVAVRV